MDEIQKVLVKAGRKDLAGKYYKLVGASDEDKYKTALKNIQKGFDAFEKVYMKNMGAMIIIKNKVLKLSSQDFKKNWNRLAKAKSELHYAIENNVQLTESEFGKL